MKRSIRKIVLGIAVMVMSTTLRHTWMFVTQFVLGAILTAIGITVFRGEILKDKNK